MKKRGKKWEHNKQKQQYSKQQRMFWNFLCCYLLLENKFILFISLHELNKCFCVSVISSLWSYVMNVATFSSPFIFYSSFWSWFFVWRVFLSAAPKTLKKAEALFEQLMWTSNQEREKKMLINFAKFVFRNSFWEVVSSALVFSIKPSLSFTKYEHADCWNFKNKHQLPKWPVIFAFRNDFDDVVREKKMRLDMTLRETRPQQGNESR